MTTEFTVWQKMRQRCENPNNPAYQRYGGRGITICERWRSFENFLADMGRRPRGRTLDRSDNNGPYGPENCRWATPSEQGNNTRINHRLTFDGRTQTLTEWARELGISADTLKQRIAAYGWTVERALTTPVHRKNPYASRSSKSKT